MPEHDTVISNTTPLLYLHRIRHLHVLTALYTRVVVPEAVASEIETGREGGADVPDLGSHPWIEIRSASIPQSLQRTDLGPGESAVLALALARAGSLAILDDAYARRIASSHGVRHTGTAAILVKAKTRGLVPLVAPLLDAMVEAGFFLGRDVRDLILRAAGEID